MSLLIFRTFSSSLAAVGLAFLSILGFQSSISSALQVQPLAAQSWISCWGRYSTRSTSFLGLFGTFWGPGQLCLSLRERKAFHPRLLVLVCSFLVRCDLVARMLTSVARSFLCALEFRQRSHRSLKDQPLKRQRWRRLPFCSNFCTKCALGG